MTSIVAVTLNPGFDEFVCVDAVRFGGVGKLVTRKLLPSGKGVNAARVAASLTSGLQVVAIQPVPHRDLERFQGELEKDGVTGVCEVAGGELRQNLTVLSTNDSFVGAHFRADGLLEFEQDFIDMLEERLRHILRCGDVLTLNGSVPLGLHDSIWASLAAVGRECGARIILDVYGPALPLAVRDGGLWAATPNDVEVADLVGDSEPTVRSRIRTGILGLLKAGIELPVVTAGKLGTWFYADGEILRASVHVENPKFVVGAGDAFVAGLAVAVARDSDIQSRDAVHMATAVAGMWIAGVSREEFRSQLPAFLDQTVIGPGEV